MAFKRPCLGLYKRFEHPPVPKEMTMYTFEEQQRDIDERFDIITDSDQYQGRTQGYTWPYTLTHCIAIGSSIASFKVTGRGTGSMTGKGTKFSLIGYSYSCECTSYLQRFPTTRQPCYRSLFSHPKQGKRSLKLWNAPTRYATDNMTNSK